MNSSSVLTITAIALLLIHSQGQQVDSAKTPSLPGTYYSAQSIDSPKRPVMPPMPVNPFPELPVYSIGDGLFVYDDRGVDYATLRKEAAEKAAAEGSAPGGALAAEAGGGPPMATLKIGNLGNGTLAFGITTAPAGSVWDLYFVNNIVAERWQWRRVYSGVQCDANGEATFRLQQPDAFQGFFVILNAADDDGDGLSNGYEEWFNYNGQETSPTDPESDLDGMKDGWEVAYGVNPMKPLGPNPPPPNDPDGGGGNPDNDTLTNLEEHNNNEVFGAPSYDPLKPFGSTQTGQRARPVVTISAASSEVYKLSGNTTSFTISRSIGQGAEADLNQSLTVYYSVGGSAVYGTDYSLPAQPDYPRIFSAKIEQGQMAVTVPVTLAAGGVRQAGTQTIVPKLTPYGVAVVPQVADPLLWEYVVDQHHQAVTLNIHDGIVINLERTVPDGYLRIKGIGDATPLPFINVANSARGTVARIYTGGNLSSDPSRIVGEYWTIPGAAPAPAANGDPSRTTVDRYGNVWVGNRAIGDADGGSITKFGFVLGGTRCNSVGSPDPNGEYLKPPFIHNTCVDRHGATVNDPPDGLIRTARGSNLQLPWPNTGDTDTLGGVSTAEDEAILEYLRVVPKGVRTIVADANNNLWVGGGTVTPPRWHEFIDTLTTMQVTGRRLNFNCGGYGAVIGGDGAIWSSGFGTPLLRFQPGIGMPVTTGGPIRNTSANYGIGVDPLTGDVWQSLHTFAEVMQFRSDHCSTKFPMGQLFSKGIVIDGHGNVWVGPTGSSVVHLTTSGALVGTVPMTLIRPGQPTITRSQPIGVAVDSSGKIWAICYGGPGAIASAMRIDPSRGPIPPGSDRPVGQVVEAVDLGTGTLAYNYSDMSGFVTLSTAQPSGVWNHVEDSGTDETLWTSLNMDAVVPVQTRIVVEVRAANKITDLPSWEFRPVVNAGGVTPPGTTSLPAGIKGRYLEVRANLLRDFGVSASPELRSLVVQHGNPGCAINITAHPRSQAVLPGATVQFTVTAQVPAGATATYQWLKDGVDVAGATAATLTINNAQFTEAGRYSVKVGTVSGCTFQLESSPARLHVKGNPPAIIQGQDLPPSVSVAEHGNVTLTAQASAGTNPGEHPIFYQWRFNNKPISGASGTCQTGDCTANGSVAGQCTNAGFYSVVFWNEYGQVATENCELRITGKNPVGVTPTTVSVTSPNQNSILTASTCLGDVNCIQWYLTRAGMKAPIPGATNLTYTIPTPITCEHIGTYTVSVGDSGWNAYEATVTVTSAEPSQFSTTFSTSVKIIPDNTGPWNYQWFQDDGSGFFPITGATSDSHTPTLLNNYKAVATRPSDGLTAEVRVHYAPAPNPALQAFSVQAIATQGASLSVTYTVTVNPSFATYRWYFTREGTSTEMDTGVTTTQFTVNPVDCTKQGTYRFAAMGCNSTVSRFATLDVANPSVIIAGPTLKITPDNIGTGDWMYQWSDSSDGSTFSDITGATSDSYTISQDRVYRVLATRSGATAEIRVDYTPSSRFAFVFGIVNATFSATYTPQATGVGGLIYHWYFRHKNEVQEQDLQSSNPAYPISPVDCTKQGTYRVNVSYSCGAGAEANADTILWVDSCQ